MDGWMHGCMDAYMDGWMDAWMHGWMDGWMDGWTEECTLAVFSFLGVGGVGGALFLLHSALNSVWHVLATLS